MTPSPAGSRRPFPVRLIRFFLPLALIAAAVAVANHLYATRPVARRGQPRTSPPLVDTLTVAARDHQVGLPAMGTVVPARTILLKSRVGGFVMEKSPRMIPGGIFKKDQVMLRLDPADVRLDIQQKKAALDRLKAALRLEMGRQKVARAEVDLLLDRTKDPIPHTGLALREPQLAQIQADIAMAQAELARVELTQERTVIKAPFNCQVMSVNVEEGSQISTQETLAQLSGTDRCWIRATLPVDQLKWVTFPRKPGTTGSSARIRHNNAPPRKGQVLRLLGELTSDTRLATLLIAVEDPLDLGHNARSPLLLNSYVAVEIAGPCLPHTLALPRHVIRDDHTLWCVEKGHLVIKSVTPLWQDDRHLYVRSGISPGDVIIVSDLSTPIPGMALTTRPSPAPSHGKNLGKDRTTPPPHPAAKGDRP